MALQVCVWDLDGTLLYTLPTIHYYCNQSLVHFGLHEITLAECQDLCRLSIAHFYHKLLALGGCPAEEIDRLQPAIRDYDCASYLRNFTYLTTPYPGVADTIRTLRARGIRSACLTNKPNDVACSLIGHFFGGLIDVCIGQTPDSISKPDPCSMDRMLELLGVGRDEVLYIGDTDVDMETARNTRTAAAAAAWGYQPLSVLEAYHPAYILHEPGELLSVFRTTP